MNKKMYFLPLLILLAVFPVVVQSSYIERIAVLSFIFSILALSLGMLVGGIRVVSLSQVAFFGIGAYTSAILTVRYEVPFLLAMICAVLLSALIGFLFSVPILRLKGHFLAMGTLAFGIVAELVFLNWSSVTNGPNGIPGIPYPSIFGFVLDSNMKMYYFTLIALVLIVIGLFRINRAPIGRSLTAIREDEIAAATFGIHTVRYKVLTFTVSTGIAGFAGVLFAHYNAYINYNNFSLMESFMVLAMVIVGGMNQLLGPVIGAVLLTVLPEVLRGLEDYRMLIYGVILVLILPFAPQGLLGEVEKRMKRRRRDGSTNDKSRSSQ